MAFKSDDDQSYEKKKKNRYMNIRLYLISHENKIDKKYGFSSMLLSSLSLSLSLSISLSHISIIRAANRTSLSSIR